MKLVPFVKESVVAGTPAQVWEFHEDPETFRLLLPPFERSEVLQLPAGLIPGSEVRTKTWIGPIPTHIYAKIIAAEKPDFFEDEMISGPFAYWRHRHEFLPGPTSESTLYRDTIWLRPPLGILGRLARPFAIDPRVGRVFEYRHQVVAREMPKWIADQKKRANT
jgi:ligand-binding SRPBCC domain-containing protein